MGRITIFSITECRFCQRTKAAVKERNIPYTEINLTDFPSKRSDMIQVADSLTVPQVFFNEKHIGGAEDTLKILEEWGSSALEKYQTEIATQPDPSDPRLQVPDPSLAVKETPPIPRPDMYSVLLPNSVNKKATVLEVTEKLKSILPRATLKHNLSLYKNAFTGREAVETMMKEYNIGESVAVEFGQTLQKQNILHHVCGHDHDLKNTDSLYFRLQCYQTPEVLNSYRIWSERADNANPMALLKRLKKLLSTILSVCTDASSGKIDYKKAAQHADYTVFEEAVCELQKIDLGAMDDTTRMAFGINVYNLMIPYAFSKVGIPNSTVSRGSFFSTVAFNLGGHVFSFSELENGVLRSNRKPPYSLSVPFGKSDPRLALVVRNADCRIHFALNCGAKSCPPVKNFTADALDEELRIVAQAFCESDDGVRVDIDKRTVHLSMILNWYRVDFASSNSKLPETIVEFLRGEKKQSLQQLIDGDGGISVKFLEYDWSTNASTDFVIFDSSVLKANEMNPLKTLLF